VRQQFNEHLDRKLSEVKESWSNDVDADWSLLSSVTQRKDLFDDECEEQASKRRAAEKALHGLPNRTRAQQRAADEARENYRAINRECNRFFRRKKREQLNGMVEEIQTASERKNPRTMYKTISSVAVRHRGPTSSRMGMETCWLSQTRFLRNGGSILLLC
jgi:hypothetical protein